MKELIIICFILIFTVPTNAKKEYPQRKTSKIQYFDISEELAGVIDYCIYHMKINEEKDILEITLSDIEGTKFNRTYVGVDKPVIKKASIKDAINLGYRNVIGFGERRGVVFVISFMTDEELNNCPHLKVNKRNKNKTKLIEKEIFTKIPPNICPARPSLEFEIDSGKIYRYK